MSYMYYCCTCIFLLSSCFIAQARSSKDECRYLEFRATQAFHGQRLMNQVIRSAEVTNKEFCGALCFMEPKCASYNLLTTKNENGKQKCELNNGTYEENKKDMQEDSNYVYHGAKNACTNVPCKNEGTCQTGFTHKGYRCLCPMGFTGQDCESDIDECAAGTFSCDANAVCTDTKGSYICSCKTGYQGDGKTCEDVDECTAATHNCIHTDLCENTIGSFECLQTPTTMTPTTAECLLKTTGGQCCSIPFIYEGVTYHACTRVDHYRRWCSLDPIYRGNWENCA